MKKVKEEIKKATLRASAALNKKELNKKELNKTITKKK